MWVRDRTSAELVVGPADQLCQCCCCWGGERVEDLFEQGPRMAATAARERHSVRRPPRHLPPAGQGFVCPAAFAAWRLFSSEDVLVPIISVVIAGQSGRLVVAAA